MKISKMERQGVAGKWELERRRQAHVNKNPFVFCKRSFGVDTTRRDATHPVT